MPLFSVLVEEERERLAAAARTRPFRRGQFLFFEGDDSGSLGALLDGRLKLVVSSPAGEELLLRVIERGAVFGEVGVVDGGPRSATVEALTDGRVVLLAAEEIWRLLRSNTMFVEAMFRQVTATTRSLTGTTADMVFLDLPKRMAKLLLTTGSESEPGLLSGLNQSEIGSRLGASRQAVNTTLGTFARRGWVELGRQEIRVLDRAALERFAATA